MKAAGSKLKYHVDLFSRDVKLLDDFLYAGSGFQILEYG